MTTKKLHDQPGQARNTDSKGRVTLGQRFANRTVLIQFVSDNEAVIKLARVIPEDELWLYQNSEAHASAERGLEQIRRGELASPPPSLAADAEFADSIPDDE